MNRKSFSARYLSRGTGDTEWCLAVTFGLVCAHWLSIAWVLSFALFRWGIRRQWIAWMECLTPKVAAKW